MSLLLLIHTVIHPNDLNILLVDVVLNNVALSKFPQQNFHDILQYELLHFDSLQQCIAYLALTYYLYIHSMNFRYCFQ